MGVEIIDEEVMPEHWQTGCSNAKRWVNCPGSKFAKDEREPGIKTLRGTLGHKIVEALLRGEAVQLDEDDARVIESLDPIDKEIFTDAVMMCFDYVRGEMGTMAEGDSIAFEVKIKSERVQDHGGTVDVILYRDSDQSLHVIDYKFGQTPVDAEGNYQIAAYLNLARQEFPAAKKFFGTIVQPAYRGVDTVEVTEAWLDDWLVKAAVAADPANMERKASYEWCEWCPLLATCKEAAIMGRQVAHGFDAVKEVKEPTPEEVEAVEKIAFVAKIAAKQADGAAKLLKEWAGNGAKLNFHKVTTSTKRAWKEHAEVDLEDLCVKGELDRKKVFIEKPLTAPQLQKLLKMDRKEFDQLYGNMLDCKQYGVLRVGTKPDARDLAEFGPLENEPA